MTYNRYTFNRYYGFLGSLLNDTLNRSAEFYVTGICCTLPNAEKVNLRLLKMIEI